MNKLLAGLIASFFAVSTALAASHAGAPMTPASGTKAEAKAPEAAAAEKKPTKKTKAKGKTRSTKAKSKKSAS